LWLTALVRSSPLISAGSHTSSSPPSGPGSDVARGITPTTVRGTLST
jgi:hypothetical protein